MKSPSPKPVAEALAWLVPHISRYSTLPTRAYAHVAYDAKPAAADPVRMHALEQMELRLADCASRLGYGHPQIEKLGTQLRSRPVIQTGPHCYLAFEPDAFYTHIFSAMGLRSHKDSWYVTHSSSTVKFQESDKKGPGWLRLGGQHFNLFGLSNRKMGRLSVCGRDAPQRFALTSAKQTGIASQLAERLKRALPDDEFLSAADAIKTANQSLWRRFFASDLHLLQFDDWDVGDLVAQHLRDPSSWLSSTLFGPSSFAKRLLNHFASFDCGQWADWAKTTTDFFWHFSGGRIFPLRLRDGLFLNESGTFSVQCAPDALLQSLNEREIIPSMLLSFFVTSILPGVRVLGGSRQIVYYPIMRYALLSTLSEFPSPANRSLSVSLGSDQEPSLWGHRTISPGRIDPFSLMTQLGCDFGRLIDCYGEIPLSEAWGSLPAFAGDPLWQTLCKRLAKETALEDRPIWLAGAQQPKQDVIGPSR
ncbi:hypothetical protein Mesau_05678 [Mesorhizobium australicum WSM2073]|uniref:Uncharacterized protein n=3 Tax=Mesorhizobium TaxID=68287 RepID=L0KS82_MESAW|nr:MULTISPECIES: hypothetical protein [Mesorhizobium]ADV14718.1 hypothetical protein Mesci_5626 [Mesorhizobium ciceri biovar biserrulae WSM1271]AEH90604.1 conserved hypothetical protein [Mesorhizobium opportunistum WSM2075]AGB47976.1 hypothetical protein Mesau_05678 [Mesorhizobium australicum WSM2073]OBP89934.1 hypothetical protein BAE40_13580 [Mesorhizobium loti]